MRLTWKLSLALTVGVLLVLVGYAALRVRANVEAFRRDVALGQRDLALAMATVLESVTEREGEARARELLERVAAREAPMVLRWSAQTGTPPLGDDVVSRVLEEDDATPQLESRVAVRLRGHPASELRVVEPLAREPEAQRDAMERIANTSAVVLGICITLILGFGMLFVGRPLQMLRNQARRIGRGERGLRTEIDSRDEIGDLAREMNAMAASLDQAADRVQREQEARLETLERLRHADRLRTVGELAASVAHDLGTPMGTVSARAQLIARGEVDAARARELAGSIVDEIERMSRSIRALLDHGRREAPAPTRARLDELAGDVVRLLGPLARSRGVRIVVEGAGGLEATIDVAQIRHVLVNLVSNAIDASPAGEVVEVAVDVAEGAALEIEVRDRGVGVPDELRERVFDPFFTTKARGHGTGLGLSIARGIAIEHGGTIEFVAREGGGSRFVLSLPRTGAAPIAGAP